MLLSCFVPLICITREIVIAHSYFKVEGFPLVQWFPKFGLHIELCRLLIKTDPCHICKFNVKVNLFWRRHEYFQVTKLFLLFRRLGKNQFYMLS